MCDPITLGAILAPTLIGGMAGAGLGTAATITAGAIGLGTYGLVGTGIAAAAGAFNDKSAGSTPSPTATSTVIPTVAADPEKTATSILDKSTQKRDISSLRIPLSTNKATNTGGDLSTGINIPM